MTTQGCGISRVERKECGVTSQVDSRVSGVCRGRKGWMGLGEVGVPDGDLHPSRV